MKNARVGACVAVALLTVVTGCSSTERPPHATGVTSMQGSSPSEQDQGWAVLVQADREINRLQALRDSMSDPFDRDAATHDLQAIQVGSDALMDEMSLGDGRSHDAEIRSLSARLQRAMNAGEAAESQPQAPAAR